MSVTVLVIDNSRPYFTNCPFNGNDHLNYSTDPHVSTKMVGLPIALAADNADSHVSVTSVSQPFGFADGTVFLIGTTVVTYTASDASGNTATCVVSISVLDTEAPELNCPEVVSIVMATDNNASAMV